VVTPVSKSFSIAGTATFIAVMSFAMTNTPIAIAARARIVLRSTAAAYRRWKTA